MKNYLTHKDKYFKKFADAITEQFRSIRYGITSCNKETDLDLATMRYELASWQSCGDYCSLSEVRSNYKKWLPLNFCQDDVCYVNINIVEGAGKSYHITPPQSVWTLVHDLGFNPSVTTTDENGQEIFGTVVYVNSVTIQITFSQPVAGWAYLS